MTTSKGPTTAPTVTGPDEPYATAKQLGLTVQRSGEDPWILVVRVQSTGGVTPAAPVLALIAWVGHEEVIVVCHGCGGAHRHHVAHDVDQPFTHRGTCGISRAIHVLPLDGAR